MKRLLLLILFLLLAPSFAFCRYPFDPPFTEQFDVFSSVGYYCFVEGVETKTKIKWDDLPKVVQRKCLNRLKSRLGPDDAKKVFFAGGEILRKGDFDKIKGKVTNPEKLRVYNVHFKFENLSPDIKEYYASIIFNFNYDVIEDLQFPSLFSLKKYKTIVPRQTIIDLAKSLNFDTSKMKVNFRFNKLKDQFQWEVSETTRKLNECTYETRNLIVSAHNERQYSIEIGQFKT